MKPYKNLSDEELRVIAAKAMLKVYYSYMSYKGDEMDDINLFIENAMIDAQTLINSKYKH